MNMSKVTSAATAAVGAVLMLAIAPEAHGEVEFRYDSRPIPWNFTSVNRWESSEYGSGYLPYFSIAFTAPDSWLRPDAVTIFEIPTPSIRAWTDRRDFSIDQSNDALIAISPDGNIVGWRFSYDLSPVFTSASSPREIAINQRYNIYSTNSMGSSCPCDNFTIYWNDLVYDNGVPLPDNRLISNYRDLNDSTPNWSVRPISAVPEPHPSLMLLGGLGIVGWLARRSRKEALFEPTADKRA